MDIYDRFLSKVAQASNGCWIWIGARNEKGYGRFRITTQQVVYAHRWSYEHHVGPIPDGLSLLHSCDTPPCVNPRHLSPGTQFENLEFMRVELCARHGTPMTRKPSSGHTYCTACNTERMRAYRARKKGAP